MDKLVINIFNQDVNCITELIASGFNVTHFERIAIAGKNAILVNVDGLDGLAISAASNRKIEDALFAYYANNNPIEIIYRLKQKAVKRIARGGIELAECDIHTPYGGKINAAVCRSASAHAKLLAQCRAVANARKSAADIAKECLEEAIRGGNMHYAAVDFSKIDKDELITRLIRLDYKCKQDPNVSNVVIVSW